MESTWLSYIPTVNACFNSLATVCIISGLYSVKKYKIEAHKKWMVAALSFSTLFLVGYLTYHFHHPTTKFPELGWIKTIYLIILFSHIILAVGMLPLIIGTVYFALKKRLDKHRKWAKICAPIWLYVSVTGVVIYLMLYHFFA